MPFQFRKEAIEEDLNTNFPSQGQGNPPLYYSLSEVVVPTYSINQAAEGSILGENLQTAWDFSTGHQTVNSTSLVNVISNTGFWLVELQITARTTQTGAVAINGGIALNDGSSTKIIFQASSVASGSTNTDQILNWKGVVFINSGQTLQAQAQTAQNIVNVQYRQIADLNGNLVNPLGFSAA